METKDVLFRLRTSILNYFLVFLVPVLALAVFPRSPWMFFIFWVYEIVVLFFAIKQIYRVEYLITPENILIREGFKSKLEKEFPVGTIEDCFVKQNFFQKWFGIGDVIFNLLLPVKDTVGKEKKSVVFYGVDNPFRIQEFVVSLGGSNEIS